MAKHYLQIKQNPAGGKLAIMWPLDDEGKLSSGFRIAGQRAWGRSKTIAEMEISTDDLTQYITEYAPDVLEKLIATNR